MQDSATGWSSRCTNFVLILEETLRSLGLRNPPTEAAERGRLAYALDGSVAPEARELAAYLAWAFGASTQAVIHYGSRAQGRRTRSESAFDYFVIVDQYADAYRSLAATAGLHRAGWLVSSLARVLAPNVVSLRCRSPQGDRMAKVAVFSVQDFGRETSDRARDHFTQARLMQHVVLAWVRDVAAERLVADAVVRTRRRTLEWIRPFLPDRFNVEDYGRALLAQSLRSEIRPEGTDHARELFHAQRGTLVPVFEELLAEGTRTRVLVEHEATFSLRTPPGALERMRWRWFFRRSKARNTIRLFKHIALYDGWLDYVVHKIARASGELITVTERERRWPLVFVWPKFIRYLRTRPQRRN